jgi:hypothetical protein
LASGSFGLGRTCLSFVLSFVFAGALPAGATQTFRRGDANADGRIDITDPIQTLGLLFQGTPTELPCRDAADATDDGAIDISDPVRTLGYLFLGSTPPPPPFGPALSDCGEDPTPDALSCEQFSPCPADSGPPAAPRLQQPDSPTRSLSTDVRGTAGAGLAVVITGGEGLVRVDASADGAFVATVALVPNRRNRLFAVAEDAQGRASAPATVEVTHDGTPPFVYVDEPLGGATVLEESVTVAGRVADILSGFLGLAVTVNDAPAAIAIGIGTNGTFERRAVPLALGENLIVARATDAAGNTASHEIRVTRSLPPADADRLERMSGDGQRQSIHAELPEPIVVRAARADGTPFPGRVVMFRVTRSDGRLAASPGVAAEDGSLTLAALTDAGGLARAHWRLGSDAGCGNNRVQASGAGLADVVAFCASADPGPAAQINIGSGNGQLVETGAPAPERLRAWVSDGCNGIAGVPVTFTVLRGGGLLDGAAESTVMTGMTGHASIGYVFGPEPGEQIVAADFPGQGGSPALFSLFGIPRGEGTPTSLGGLVLDNASQPLGGVACALRLRSGALLETSTSADGRFSFANIAESGLADLLVQGHTATTRGGAAVPQGSFPSLHFEPVLVPNAANALARPVLLPRLDPRNARTYSTTEDTILTVAGIEGLEMRIRAGSMRLPNGELAPAGSPVSLNLVHSDDVPMPMPDGAAPLMNWTLQPGGARFDPPISVTYPNMSGLAAGAIANFLSFNLDTGQYDIVSSGRVSSDGSSITSDAGSGISLAGWGGSCPPYVPTNFVVNCSLSLTVSLTDRVVCVGDPVRVTASAGPGPGQIIVASPGGDPPANAFTESGAFGSVIVTFETKYSTPGEKTITVSWLCSAGDVKVQTVTVSVVEIVSITATVGHITNPSQCAGVADFSADTFTSISSDESMSANLPLSIPRGTRPVMVAVQLDPAGSAPSRLKWKIRRNAEDIATGLTPAQPPPGLTFTLDTDAQGSFHVTCYCDRNGNDQPDADEEKKVLNLVLVGIEVTSFLAMPHPAELVQSFPNSTNVRITSGLFDFSQPNRAAVHCSATVLLTGGGADATLGVGTVTVLFLQNFSGDTFTSHYAGGKTVREVFTCDPSVVSPICSGTPVIMSFNVLDNASTGYPTGFETPAAPCCHRETALGLDGRRRFVEWIDSPRFNSPGVHPCGGGEALASTSGSNDFVAYLAAYGLQSGHNYVYCGLVEWTVTVSGTVAPDLPGNLVWTRDAAAGITASAMSLAVPQDAAAERVMVYGPSYGSGNIKCDAR